MTSSEKRTIYAALAGNIAIAVMKFIAAAVSGSSAMMAEAFHSSTDTANQLMLLVGHARARRPPDEDHPFGHGKELYFWAFMVAVSIFFVGGSLSVYEGVHKMMRPEGINGFPFWPLIVLGGAFLIEGASLSVAVREARGIRREFGGAGYIDIAVHSKNPTVIVILFEDSAALLGLLIAAAGILASYYTGNPFYDAAASVLIGLLLVAVAVFLAGETKKLLIGESASPRVRRRMKEVITALPEVRICGGILTMHLGPEEILANIDIEFIDGLSTDEVEQAIDKVEEAIRKALPAVRKIYIEAQTLKKTTRPTAPPQQ